MNKAGNFLAVILVIACIAAGALVGAGLYLNTPYPGSDGHTFTIERGSSVAHIAVTLEKRGIIRSRYFFMFLTRAFRTQGNLQAGNYYIPHNYSSLKIHDLFLSGRQMLKTVTIPEGYTLSQIARVLEEANIVSADEFKAAATDVHLLEKLGISGTSSEGYLYPDTYRFVEDFPADKTVTFLVASFFNKVREIYPDYTSMTSGMLQQAVILASIIEREYRLAEEAPYIASVFLNRLKIGMPLQSCATVVFALTEEYGKPHPAFLTYRDLEVNSAYNTYRHNGLPPSPICNPGPAALKSVFFPAETDYLYFVLKDKNDGSHYFSKTLIEHNQAKQFFIKGR